MVLDERDVDPDPFVQFARWYEEASSSLPPDRADAMVVATAGADGAPSARVVLLRGADENGFRFYTNYDSRKGRELADNPRAELVLHWPELQRQVRVRGAVRRVDEAETRAYWRNRPRASQLSAWASPQSEPVADRETLEAEVARREVEFAGRDMPVPPSWGGYRVEPDEVELWQHCDNRLHDRLRYRRNPEGDWRLERLAP